MRAITDYDRVPIGREGPGLAFPEAGTYTITIVYPLIGAVLVRPDGNQRLPTFQITTNSIQVRIEHPTGDDAQVFEQIQSPELLSFLRDGRYVEEPNLSVLKAAGLLKKHPDTGYGEALRHSLLEFYHSSKGSLERDDIEMIRRLLGEPDERLFPNDPRLEQEIVLDFPQPTPLDKVFASLRAQAGCLSRGRLTFSETRPRCPASGYLRRCGRRSRLDRTEGVDRLGTAR